MDKISEKEAKNELEGGYGKAKELLKDEEKLEKFLQRLEKKLKLIPIAGTTLSMIPTMVSLVRNYVKKRYKQVPLGSIMAIVSALIYFFTPLDLIPDSLPGVGFIDDATVVATCLKLVKSDIDEYQNWRSKNKDIKE